MRVLTQRRGAAEEHIFAPETHQNRWMNTNNAHEKMARALCHSDLFIVRPQAKDFDDAVFLNNLIDQSVLNIDSS